MEVQNERRKLKRQRGVEADGAVAPASLVPTGAAVPEEAPVPGGAAAGGEETGLQQGGQEGVQEGGADAFEAQARF